MRRGKIFGRDVEMQGSPLTLLIYKREFEGDLFADLVEAMSGETYDMEAFMRFAWAMAKTRNDEIADYEHWLEEFPAEFSLLEGQAALGVILSAADAELFRGKPTMRQKLICWLAG